MKGHDDDMTIFLIPTPAQPSANGGTKQPAAGGGDGTGALFSKGLADILADADTTDQPAPGDELAAAPDDVVVQGEPEAVAADPHRPMPAIEQEGGSPVWSPANITGELGTPASAPLDEPTRAAELEPQGDAVDTDTGGQVPRELETAPSPAPLHHPAEAEEAAPAMPNTHPATETQPAAGPEPTPHTQATTPQATAPTAPPAMPDLAREPATMDASTTPTQTPDPTTPAPHVAAPISVGEQVSVRLERQPSAVPSAQMAEAAAATTATAPATQAPVALTSAPQAAQPAPVPAPQQPPAPLHTQLARPAFGLIQAGQGEHVMTMSVTPENLGPVTIRAHINGEQMRLELFAPTDAGREALRSMVADLRRDLAGLVPAGTLTISSSDSPPPANQSSSGGQQGAGGSQLGEHGGERSGRGEGHQQASQPGATTGYQNHPQQPTVTDESSPRHASGLDITV